ncbi:hypothetical protein HA052_09020 [Chromobacterium haemolyticum]|uniref:Uncharacterized protein n=1 Tax=Chromobacterium fluminis TaxID=3044269 RepID=A0ABX0L8I7_9NEIS|nr:hypothetical protein [Chromobacterium haemolyticum]
MEYLGQYQVNRNHELESPLKRSIADMKGAAARFAADAINDAKIRVSYEGNIQRMAQAVLDEVHAGSMTAKEGMEFATDMRNKIMMEHRAVTSAQGVAAAEKHKLKGRTIKELLDKTAGKIFNKGFDSLTSVEQNKVYYAIIESSARPSGTINTRVKVINVMGKVGWVVTATLATYAIANAGDKKKEIVRQGAIIGGGMAGGYLAGILVTPICGPGAPICAIAVVLVGSVIGAGVSEHIVDSIDEEMEEFAKWNMQ